jgi:DNA-binding winged helix-turn-helix (wHTH) protein
MNKLDLAAARLDASGKTAGQKPMSTSAEGIGMIRIGVYTLDTRVHVLHQGGQQTQISPLASRFLQLLATRPGLLFERTEIIEALWRGDWLVGDPALSRLVSELRRAAGDDAKRPTLVQTVPRRGYRLVVDEAAAPTTRLRTGEAGDAPPTAGTRNAPPLWQRAWNLANASLLILLGGSAVILTLALLIRHFR